MHDSQINKITKKILSSAEFTHDQLAVLGSIRDENRCKFDDLIKELSLLLKSEEKSVCYFGTLKQKSYSKKNRGLYKYLADNYRLAKKALLQAEDKKSLLCCGLDLSRLYVDKKYSLLEIIQAHIPEQNVDLNDFLESDQKGRMDVYFDARLGYSDSKGSLNDSIYLLTPLTFILMGLATIPQLGFLLFFKLAGMGLAKQKQTYKSTFKRVLSVILLSLYILGVYKFFSQFEKKKILCLTSNSVFLEALRAMALSYEDGDVIEIQHGVPTPLFDKYFYSYADKLDTGKRGRLKVYPLLGRPYCQLGIKRRNFDFQEIPINTALYKSLHIMRSEEGLKVARRYSKTDLLMTIKEAANSFVMIYRPIIAVLGGTDANGENEYYESDSFKIEIELIKMFLKELRTLNLEPIVVYLPHPKNAYIEKIFFQDPTPIPIVIDKNTHLSYFYADFAISLYSSSIFEAAYFGVKAFTPMPVNFDVFYKESMSQLYAPEKLTYQDIKMTIQRCCQDFNPTEYYYNTKISERINTHIY